MMYKTFTCLVILVLGFSLWQGWVQAESIEQVLILYDQEFRYTEPINERLILEHLMSRFDVEITSKDLATITADELNLYHMVIILTHHNFKENSSLLHTLVAYQGKQLWIGPGFKQYIQASVESPVEIVKNYTGYTKVNYTRLDVDELTIYDEYISPHQEFIFLTGGNFSNWASRGVISDGLHEYPLIINNNNIWYLSTLPYQGALLNVVADILYDICCVSPPQINQLYIRLEDIHPLSDPKLLQACGQLLIDKNIPFMIALIPTYHGAGIPATTLDQAPQLVAVLQFLQSEGASIILHGYTHGMSKECTGEGYEFWDGDANRPLPDIDTLLQSNIQKGLEICLRNQLYPLAFEAPHYAMTRSGYATLKTMFTTVVGQIQINNWDPSLISYPYLLKDHQDYGVLLPENLGFFNPPEPDNLLQFKTKYRQLKIVRGFLGGLFYHPYLGTEGLDEILSWTETLRLQDNITYFDLRQITNQVDCNDMSIISHQGSLSFTIPERLNLQEKSKSLLWLVVSNSADILIGLTSLCVLLFMMMYIRRSRRNQKNLFR